MKLKQGRPMRGGIRMLGARVPALPTCGRYCAKPSNPAIPSPKEEFRLSHMGQNGTSVSNSTHLLFARRGAF